MGASAISSEVYFESPADLIRAAAVDGDIKLTQSLIRSRVDVNEHLDEDGYAPLTVAAENGHLQIVKMLVRARAEVNRRHLEWSDTALHKASAEGHFSVVKYLVEMRASLTDKCCDGFCALTYASSHGHLSSVRFLIKAKADVSDTNEEGFTALHWAAREGHVDIIRLLVRDGKADTEVKNSKGLTPLFFAFTPERFNSVKCLVELKANVNDNTVGFTVLHHAAANAATWKDSSMVKYLLKAKADPMATTSGGKTVIDVATTDEAKRFLLEAKSRGSRLSISSISESSDSETLSIEGKSHDEHIQQHQRKKRLGRRKIKPHENSHRRSGCCGNCTFIVVFS
mmetsp:Transcript_14784/g.36123  ORF Transcript_14784/g.36123 Transcript_14784/m.36123 type:complete len:341 (-) Transcript_14784:381-1403(-)